MTVIIGLDPGSINTGYGIIRKNGSRIEHIASGVISVKGSDVNSRLPIIFTRLQEIIAEYKPDHCVIEQVFIAHNPQTGVKLGMARGVAILAASLGKAIIFELSARQAKKFVTGRGDADKALVNRMVVRFLGLTEAPKLDTSDALALAISHAQTLNARHMILQQQSTRLLDERSQKRLLSNALNFNALNQVNESQQSMGEALQQINQLAQQRQRDEHGCFVATHPLAIDEQAYDRHNVSASESKTLTENLTTTLVDEPLSLEQRMQLVVEQQTSALSPSVSSDTPHSHSLSSMQNITKAPSVASLPMVDEQHWQQSQLSNIKINDKRFGFRTGKEKNRKSFEHKLKEMTGASSTAENFVFNSRSLAKVEAAKAAGTLKPLEVNATTSLAQLSSSGTKHPTSGGQRPKFTVHAPASDRTNPVAQRLKRQQAQQYQQPQSVPSSVLTPNALITIPATTDNLGQGSRQTTSMALTPAVPEVIPNAAVAGLSHSQQSAVQLGRSNSKSTTQVAITQMQQQLQKSKK